MKKLIFFLSCIFGLMDSVYPYGPTGHIMVGAIADEKLVGTLTGQKVAQMLDGISLARAALIADKIKSWDKNGPDNHRGFHMEDHLDLEKQLSDFWKANPPLQNTPEDRNMAPIPSHNWFHYVDIPVLGEKYDSGTTGRSKWDIVHMMKYCIRVLRGEESEQNARAITKPVALILLAHYIGDIHQPFHVGAEYFDEDGHIVNPDEGVPALSDEGGSSLFLVLDQAAETHTTLHSYWDNQAVLSAFAHIYKEINGNEPEYVEENDEVQGEIAYYFASEEPSNWQTIQDGEINQIPEIWADEILPIARDAHERLQFDRIVPKETHGHIIATGFARPKPMPDGISYEDWSESIVTEELHQAGWRLADLLQKIL